MDQRAWAKLEFDRIRELLADQATFAGGKELAMACRPADSLADTVVGQEETAEGLRLLRTAGEPPFGGIRELRPQVRQTVKGVILQPDTLADLSRTLHAADALKTYLLDDSVTIERERLFVLAAKLDGLAPLTDEIDRCIDDEGLVRDGASSDLSRIRHDLNRAQRRVRTLLDNLVKSAKGGRVLQEPIITIRSGRFVVPVRQEMRAELPGIVHDQSASGVTVFVEPMDVVQINNEIRQREREEEEEIARILSALSAEIASQVDPVIQTLGVIARLDFIFAKARLATAWDAVQPQICEEQTVRIIQGRHPLLKGDVVPIDVSLGDGFSALVITGPNTGGKTVTLKTIGLFALMAQAGLHVPAKTGTRLPFLRAVYVDIGDEQSIEQSLSTFSSHMKQIVRILEAADTGSLTLLDELGAGTDPVEGSALAIAILEHLIARGSLVVATTHYSALKHFAYTFPGAKNASVEFDVDTLQPTYNLSIGVAGQSNAFAIAQRLGIDEGVLARARRQLTDGEQKVEDTIRSIEQDRREAAENREEAARLKHKYAALYEQYRQEYDRLKDRRQGLLEEARTEAARMVAEAKSEAGALLGRLRRAGGAEQLEKEAKTVRTSLDRMARGLQPPAREGREDPAAGQTVELSPGRRVHIVSIEQDGEIVEVFPDGKVLVQAGPLRLTLSPEQVGPPRESAVSRRRPPAAQQDGFSALSFDKAAHIDTELHLRGMLAEEALERLDKYLDDAVLAGLDRARIIHGKGSGRLRRAVHAYLDRDRRVREFRLADQSDGGIGATEVYF